MMQHEAPVYLAGFMVNDPKFKKVGDDVSSVKLRIAYTARWRNRETGEWADGATTFVNVQCWRQLADNVATCLRKGEPVLVMGRLRIRSYNDAEGKTRSLVEIEASSVGHDLTRGTAHFSRAYRPAGGRPVEKAQDLQRLMFDEAIGRPLAITVMRNGALVDVIAEPSELVAA